MEEMEFDLESYPQQPAFNDAIAALKTRQPSTNSVISYGLSDLTSDQSDQTKLVWDGLPMDYKRQLIQSLLESSENNFELNYRGLGLLALHDLDISVRAAAIELFWEDETLEVMDELVRLVEWDESADVRAAAAKGLGQFILQNELGNLPEHSTEHAKDVLINTFNDTDEDESVRRSALESLSNSSRDTVTDMIREAYGSKSDELTLGAIFAMGHSHDAQWSDIVMRELHSDNPEILYEAARASGELELDETIPILGHLAIHTDRELQGIAIWALGEIGGREALRILNTLAEDAEETDDDALIESIEDAIGNASLIGDHLFNLADIDE